MSCGESEQRGAAAQATGREAIALIAEFDRCISQLSFSHVTREALAFVGERLGLARASVALLEPDGAYFRVFDATREIAGLESGAVVPFASGTLGLSVERQATCYRPDLAAPPSPSNVVDDALLTAGLRSTLSVPLLVGGRCLGTLNVAAREIDGIDAATRQLVELIAPRLAFALSAGIAHERLAESEARYRDLFATVGDGILVAEVSTHRLILANTAICEMLGRSEEEVLRLTIADIHPADRLDEVVAAFEAVAQGQIDHVLDLPMLRADGTVFVADLIARPATFSGVPCEVGVFRDASRRQQQAEEQVRVQKLESIRTLSAGIAHDFNNLLTGLIGYMSLLEQHVASPDGRDMLEGARRAATRATALTRQLLTFAKGGHPVKAAVDIARVVRDSATLATSGSNARCDIDAPATEVLVLGDEGQLAQVFQNLVRNAVEAMPAGGTVQIKITAAPSPGLGKGEEARIEVRDQGAGIAPAEIERLFVPFYTTKAGGSGLGLAVVHSIVQDHGGRISVSSVEGVGSTFTVFLPRCEQRPARDEATTLVPQRSGRVLVMDDQTVVLQVADRALRRAGHETCLVEHGEQALAAYREAMTRGERFDLVILDLVVPGGMGGRETACAIRALDPDANLVASSGYSEDALMAEYQDHGFQAVLPKPYRAQELCSLVARLLGPPAVTV